MNFLMRQLPADEWQAAQMCSIRMAAAQSRRLLAQCAIPSNKALEDINTGRRTASLSGGSECGTTSVGANPLHHGTEAIRALRREMFAQTHAFEQFDGIGVQDLSCALA